MATPNMPVGVYLQEAYSIYCFAQDDKELLVSKGLDWSLVEDIPGRIEKVRDAEAQWWKSRYGETEIEKKHDAARKRIEEIKAEILRDLEFALHDRIDEYKKVIEDIRESNDRADFIFDMWTLYDFVSKQTDLLDSIGSDPALREELTGYSQTFVRTSSTHFIQNKHAARDRRDEAYAHLKAAIDELRRCAKYALWKDKKRLRGYASEYFRKTSRGRNQ